MALFSNPSNDNRPVFLDLTKIALPITALVSILHRVSGVGMIISLPVMIAMMYATVSSTEHYASMVAVCDTLWMKLFLLLVVSGTSYHILAGIRHSIDDFVGSHSLQTARITAKFVLGVWLVLVVFFVRRLWF